jgi:hypothetical protein
VTVGLNVVEALFVRRQERAAARAVPRQPDRAALDDAIAVDEDAPDGLAISE